MGLLTDIVRVMARSRRRVLHIQNATEREVYGMFSGFRRELEGQLRVYLDMWDYMNLPTVERVRIANAFPFRGMFSPLIDQFIHEMSRVEEGAMGRIRDHTQATFNDLEAVFWTRDARILPKGWVRDMLEHIDWNRLSSYMTYLNAGADKWLNIWGAEAPAQLGAGILAGEPTGVIASRITGVNIQTPENRAALGRKVWQGLQVNTRWAIVTTANEGATEGYRQLNQDYDMGLQRMWISAMDPQTCPLCLRLHGTVVGVDEQFPWRKSDKPLPYLGVLYGPPRHPNCRCGVAPFKDSWIALGGPLETPQQMHENAMVELRRRGLV